MAAQLLEDLLEAAWFVATGAWKILPVFLLSVSLGVLVRALRLDGAIRRAFSHRIGVSVLLATAVGAFSPFCSCTVIPLVAGLLIGGVPLAPVMAFWVASPTMDPEIFALSVGFLGWNLAVARLAATLVLSLAAGYLTLALTRSGLLTGKVLRREAAGPKTEPEGTGGCCSAETSAPIGPAPVAIGLKPAVATAAAAALAERPERTCGSSCDANREADAKSRPTPKPWYGSDLRKNLARGHYYPPLPVSSSPASPRARRRRRSSSAASRTASGVGPKAEKAKAHTAKPSARPRTSLPRHLEGVARGQAHRRRPV